MDKPAFDLLNPEYKAAREKAREWEHYVYGKFNKTDQLSIMGMLAYLKNMERGFGRYSDENTYASVRENDASGRLFEDDPWV